MKYSKKETKAFSNLIASLLLLVFEIWAWIETNNIKIAKKAIVQPAVFPRIMILGMAAFTLVLLVQSIIKLQKGMKPDDPCAENAETLNIIKDKGVLAAFFVILLCTLYVFFFKSLGYVAVSFLICCIIMWLIGLRNPFKLILVSLLVPLGMWLVFYKFLSVNIPMGVFQILKDLIDRL